MFSLRVRSAMAAAAAAAIAVGCSDRATSAIGALRAAAAAEPQRIFESRLSILPEHRSATQYKSSGGAPAAVQAAAYEVLRNVTASTSEGLRARAAAHLLVGHESAALDELRRGPAADPYVKSDLAAALLVEARKSGRIELTIDAIAAADEALAIRADLPEPSFNRAVALQRLGLLSQAHDEWDRCSRVDESGEWRAAARRLETRDENTEWKVAATQLERQVAAGDLSSVKDVVARFPQQARTWGESVYLTKWADGQQVGLDVARSLGKALHGFNGESLLSDSVAAIDRAKGNPRKLKQLAKAHRLYRDGRIAFRDHRLREAETLLIAAAEALSRAGSPLHLAARYYRGGVLYEAARIEEAEDLLDSLAAAAPERVGYRALAAQIGWERGLCKLMHGDLTEAHQIFLASRRILDDLRERDLRATFDLLIAQRAEYSGETGEAWQHRVRAFSALSDSGNDYRIAVALVAATASQIRKEDWSRASALAHVAAAMSEKLNQPLLASQGLLFSSRAAAERRDFKEAASALKLADRYIVRVPDAKQRERLEAERGLAVAASLRTTNPSAAAAQLDRVIAVYRRSNFNVLIPGPYLERARVYRLAGDDAAASRDLERGIGIVEEQRGMIADLDQRAAFLSVAQALCIEAADLALARGDAAGALFAVERGRARSLLDIYGTTDTARRPSSVAELQAALVPDAAIVVFAELKGRVVAFVLRSDRLSVVQSARGSESQLTPSVQRLLGGTVTVAIVGDPRLGRTPQKSLIAATLGERVLFESPSASLAVESSRAPRAALGEMPLIIAADVFDHDTPKAMEPLPRIASEARALAGIWPQSRLLVGKQATRAAFMREGPSASLIHFAGHGVHSTAHPLDAQLLLSPNGNDRAYVTAAEIARLRLHSTRVVVLNACRSAASSNRPDGVMNLAVAFEAAGARDVIAAADDVDDATAADFAVHLHRYLRDGLPPAEAFREVVRDARTRFGGDKAAAMYGGFTIFGGSTKLCKRKETI